MIFRMLSCARFSCSTLGGGRGGEACLRRVLMNLSDRSSGPVQHDIYDEDTLNAGRLDGI